MLRLNTFFKPRFGFFTLLSVAALGVLFTHVFYMQQPPLPEDPRIKKLELDNQHLSTSLVQISTALDIERKTVAEMSNTLVSLQAESLEQQLAIRFYQKVMAPEDTANGVHIEKVIIEKGANNQHMHVEVLIAQLEKRKRYIKGTVVLEAIGSVDGKPATINVSDLIENSKDLKVSFKFFQHVKSEFEFPLNFLPQYFKVTVKMPKQRGQKRANVAKEYSWNELVKAPVAVSLPAKISIEEILEDTLLGN